MPYLYIIQSQKDFSYYIGSTNNLEVRLKSHNNGYSKYTKTKLPWKCVYNEEFKTLSEARKRELQIKKQKSRKFIENLIKNGAIV